MVSEHRVLIHFHFCHVVTLAGSVHEIVGRTNEPQVLRRTGTYKFKIGARGFFNTFFNLNFKLALLNCPILWPIIAGHRVLIHFQFCHVVTLDVSDREI